jgi:hypothetical protein
MAAVRAASMQLFAERATHDFPRPSEFRSSGDPNWKGWPKISVTRQLRRWRSKADFALWLTRLQEAAERRQAECSGRILPRGLTQFPDFAEFFPAESETGEASVHVFNPVTRKIFTRPELHRQATTVLSTIRFPKAVGSGAPNAVRPEFHLKSKTSPNSSPNCLPKRLQIVLFAPPYSFEIISFPGFTIPLLTKGL